MPVEQVGATKASAKLLVEGDSHLLRRMKIGLTYIVYQYHRAQQIDGHLAIDIVKQTGAGGLQTSRITGHQLLAQVSGNGQAPFGNQTTHLGLAFHFDHPIREVVDADAILITVLYAINLVVEGGVPYRVKVQGADMVLVVFIAVGIPVQGSFQGVA